MAVDKLVMLIPSITMQSMRKSPRLVQSLRHRPSFKPALSSIPITFCGQKSAKNGLGLQRDPLESLKKRVLAVEAAAGVCMQNSTTSTTSH
jgi:hypothetical protein